MKTKNRVETNRFKKMSYGMLYNILENIVRLKISKKFFLKPILPSFFVTNRCQLKCNYCGLRKKNVKELPFEQTAMLLEKIRPQNSALSITGGEPLIRNDIVDILKKARELRFAPIFFNTNALLLHKNEEILKYVDYLLISMDSVNIQKWDTILGVKGASKTIIANIIEYSKLQKKYGFRIIINSVITHNNIEDIYDVIDFAEQIKVLASPVPEDVFNEISTNLINNHNYYKLLNDIIKMKNNGKTHIIVSELFLKQIQGFSYHNCFPTLVPRIYPDGSVFYPCSHLGVFYGNLLDYADLNSLLKEAFKRKGLPKCSFNTNKCFMSCFMEPTNTIEHPIKTFYEQLKTMK